MPPAFAVVPLYRDRRQAQFVRSEPSVSPTGPVPLDVDMLAARVCMSSRTLARRLREWMGVAPNHWLLTARIPRAQELLETCDAPIEQISIAVGFEAFVRFRAYFERNVGVNPTTYRQRFSADRQAGLKLARA